MLNGPPADATTANVRKGGAADRRPRPCPELRGRDHTALAFSPTWPAESSGLTVAVLTGGGQLAFTLLRCGDLAGSGAAGAIGWFPALPGLRAAKTRDKKMAPSRSPTPRGGLAWYSETKTKLRLLLGARRGRHPLGQFNSPIVPEAAEDRPVRAVRL